MAEGGPNWPMRSRRMATSSSSGGCRRMTLLDVDTLRKDFPILRRGVRGDRRLVYLDSGATSQKPYAVLNAEQDFYELHNAAVHREQPSTGRGSYGCLRAGARHGGGLHRCGGRRGRLHA